MAPFGGAEAVEAAPDPARCIAFVVGGTSSRADGDAGDRRTVSHVDQVLTLLVAACFRRVVSRLLVQELLKAASRATAVSLVRVRPEAVTMGLQ
jgi:hypothetical protein